MALPTLLSLYVTLRDAVLEHPEDLAGSSPAVLGVMFCPLPFAEDDIEYATLEAQAQLHSQNCSNRSMAGWPEQQWAQGLLLRQG